VGEWIHKVTRLGRTLMYSDNHYKARLTKPELRRKFPNTFPR